MVGRDKCQSVGLRKQSLLLPRQLPPLTPRATNPQGSQHNLCTDHPCQVSGSTQEENCPTSLLLAHLALLLVVGWWVEKLSWVGARSPLPGAVTLYGVYTSGAKTPAQGHGREAQGLVLARLATKSRKEGCGTAGLPPPTAEKADDGKTHGHPSPPRTPLVVHCFQGTPCNHQDDNVCNDEDEFATRRCPTMKMTICNCATRMCMCN